LAANYLVNVLFDPSPEVEAAEIPNSINCDVCGCTIRFEFETDAEGWESHIFANGNTVVQNWSTNEALRTEITMTNTGNGAIGEWWYVPGDHNKTWVVSTGDVLEALINFVPAGANGVYMFMVFTDQTELQYYFDVDTSPHTASLTVPAEHTGKTIEIVKLNYHIGPNGPIGTSTIGEWDYVQLTLASGGC
jgi:hypothetical protein